VTLPLSGQWEASKELFFVSALWRPPDHVAMGKRHSAGPQPRGETGARSCGKTQRVACHFRRRLSSQPSPGAMLLHRRQAGFRRSFSLNGPRAAAQKPAVVRQRAPSCLTHGEQQRRQPRCRLSASIPSLVPRRWVCGNCDTGHWITHRRWQPVLDLTSFAKGLRRNEARRGQSSSRDGV
jgi:hypothetical protein